MTTKELIAVLEEKDPEGGAEVVYNDSFYSLLEIQYIDWDGAGNTLVIS